MLLMLPLNRVLLLMVIITLVLLVSVVWKVETHGILGCIGVSHVVRPWVLRIVGHPSGIHSNRSLLTIWYTVWSHLSLLHHRL